jgi:hypothetical protein
MADSNQITSNLLAQTENPQRVLPDGTGQPGHTIDATFPLV